MGKYFTVQMNSKEVFQKLDEIADSVSDLKPLFKILRQSLMDSIYENFETEGTASGDKWEEWSEKWAKEREKREKVSKILQYDGDLRDSFDYKITSTDLTIGTAKEYAAIHNFGYDEKNMPQREFMRFSDTQLQDATFELHWWYLTKIKYAAPKI